MFNLMSITDNITPMQVAVPMAIIVLIWAIGYGLYHLPYNWAMIQLKSQLMKILVGGAWLFLACAVIVVIIGTIAGIRTYGPYAYGSLIITMICLMALGLVALIGVGDAQAKARHSMKALPDKDGKSDKSAKPDKSDDTVIPATREDFTDTTEATFVGSRLPVMNPAHVSGTTTVKPNDNKPFNLQDILDRHDNIAVKPNVNSSSSNSKPRTTVPASRKSNSTKNPSSLPPTPPQSAHQAVVDKLVSAWDDAPTQTQSAPQTATKSAK